ncbi:MAG: helix-turn-helix domain-containing protein [marine benthic group bacterium]|nr:helix-turn-helix domain-containing protein [Gemmatimonadota bacterium]
MKKDLFAELEASVRQGSRILSKSEAAARSFELPEKDVAAIREAYGLSQERFASLLGISVRTLQNWEQGRRTPRGPARVLLRVAALHPEAVLDAVRPRLTTSRRVPAK